MILVNNPGSWAHVYAPLRHAQWNGWTPTDVIFPFFLFIMGVAMTLSLRARQVTAIGRRALLAKVVRRSILIFLLGLFLNGYPGFDLAQLRIMGVLQRIALCYLVVAGGALFLSRRGQWVLMGGLLLAYVGIMLGLPMPGYGRGDLTLEGNAAMTIDRLILGTEHLYRQGYDPEGLVSTLTAALTTFLGLQFGLVLNALQDHRERLRRWLIWGAALTAMGLVVGIWLPVNKQLWSPSYVLLMAGLAGLSFALCYWLVELKGAIWARLARPFVMLGMNALVIFAGSGLLVRTLIRIKVDAPSGTVSAWAWGYQAVFAPLLPARLASLAFALTNVAFWLLVAWGMYRRRRFVKI